MNKVRSATLLKNKVVVQDTGKIMSSRIVMISKCKQFNRKYFY
jgi:hypothetical protein